MADERNMMQAKAAYSTLCEALDELNWKYEKNEEKLIISSGARGEDIPIDIQIEIDAERLLISLLSPIHLETPQDKRVEMACAVSAINYSLVHGSFDYNFGTGMLLFRMTSGFRDCLISKAVYTYMLYVSCKTIDDYNDKLMMLAKGMISLEQLLKTLKNNRE